MTFSVLFRPNFFGHRSANYAGSSFNRLQRSLGLDPPDCVSRANVAGDLSDLPSAQRSSS